MAQKRTNYYYHCYYSLNVTPLFVSKSLYLGTVVQKGLKNLVLALLNSKDIPLLHRLIILVINLLGLFPK